MSKSASSLYDLCLERVRDVYKYNWDQTEVLPNSIQTDLLRRWLYCDEEMDVVEWHTYSHLRSWRDIKFNMTPDLYIAIMMLPWEVPEFVHEINHVVIRFVEWVCYENDQYCIRRLCDSCFATVSKIFKRWHGNYWQENKWRFRSVHSHSVVEGEEMINIIWQHDNWCYRCITTSLLDIFSEDQCEDETEFHYMRHIETRDAEWKSNYILPNFVTDAEYAEVSIFDRS